MKFQTTGLLVLAALALTPRVAAADPASKAKAESLFRQGRELMTAGRLAEACGAFDSSQKYDPATTTLFNQADCREKNGQLATAWGLFVDAQRQTRASTDATGKQLYQVATDRANKLERRVSKVTVAVRIPMDGLAIMRGSEPVDAGEWNRKLPIDGGTYTFSARVGNREVWSNSVTIRKESDDQTVVVVIDVTKLEGKPIDTTIKPTDSTTSNSSTSSTVTTSPSPAKRGNGTAKLATAGAGIFLVGALGFELWGSSIYSDAKETKDEELRQSANKRRYVAEGMLVAGLGCGVAALYLWLRDDGTESQRVAKRKTVVPVVGQGFAGLQLDGRW